MSSDQDYLARQVDYQRHLDVEDAKLAFRRVPAPSVVSITAAASYDGASSPISMLRSRGRSGAQTSKLMFEAVSARARMSFARSQLRRQGCLIGRSYIFGLAPAAKKGDKAIRYHPA